MKYLGYSELTKRIYILPSSKRQPKIDITEDVQELMDFLSQPASKGMVGEEELMEMLNDKRIISVCGVDEGIWHISRKETARYLLEKYNITKADPTTTPSIRSKEEILEDESLMLSIETGHHWYKHLMVSERKVLNMILKAMEEYAAQFHPKPQTENDAVEASKHQPVEDRKFTLDEMKDCFTAGINRGMDIENAMEWGRSPTAPNVEDYLKDKFNL